MNKISKALSYRERWLTPSLQSAVEDHSIVVLTGARQVGKSTLLLNAAPFRDWRFHTMDDFDALAQARSNPEALWAGARRVILDEVQKAPELLLAVKKTVDRNPGKYKFALSGSANLLLMQQVGESLAGRAVYFTLDPMSLGEINLQKQPDILELLLKGELPEEGVLPIPPAPSDLMLRGFMPPLLSLNSSQAWIRWWDGYVATYLERDLRQFAQIDALLDFRKVMELAALRSAQLINQSEIARDAGLSQPTAHRYLNLLETTYLFNRLPAYAANRSTRLLKSPKAFFNDPALAVFLSGYFEAEDLRKAREYGAYFETLVYHHLRILARLMTPPARLYFWRAAQGGEEVDFVVEHGRRMAAIEVKLTDHLGYRDTAGLRAFLERNPQTSAAALVYGGKEIKRLDKKIVALPWTMITGA